MGRHLSTEKRDYDIGLRGCSGQVHIRMHPGRNVCEDKHVYQNGYQNWCKCNIHGHNNKCRDVSISFVNTKACYKNNTKGGDKCSHQNKRNSNKKGDGDGSVTFLNPKGTRHHMDKSKTCGDESCKVCWKYIYLFGEYDGWRGALTGNKKEYAKRGGNGVDNSSNVNVKRKQGNKKCGNEKNENKMGNCKCKGCRQIKEVPCNKVYEKRGNYDPNECSCAMCECTGSKGERSHCICNE